MQLEGEAFLFDHDGLLRLAFPAGVALVGLLLANAYRGAGRRTVSRPLLEAGIGLALAFVLQGGVLAAGLDPLVPWWVMTTGGAVGVLLISGLRMLFPPDTNNQLGAR
jgi:hypothetical protein